MGALLLRLPILLASFLLFGLSCPPLQAQEEQGISLERVELLLSARQTSQAILQLIRANEFCLSFRLDEESTRRLRTAGADNTLIEGLRQVAVCGEEPEAEEERAPVREEEAPPTSGTLLYSPGSAAVRSLAIPGLGQFYTGKNALGGIFLAGWAGALGFGLLSQEVTIECLAQTSDGCPAGQIRSEITERPYLAIGLGAAVAVAVASALHARSAADKANARELSAGEGAGVPRLSLHILPAQTSWRPTDLVLVQLRF